jgi:hypothetical protein
MSTITCPRCLAEFEPQANFMLLAEGGNTYSSTCAQCEFTIIGVGDEGTIDWDTRTEIPQEPVSNLDVTVTKTGIGGAPLSIGGWLVESDDGKEYLAFLTAKFRATEIPTLKTGDRMRVNEIVGQRNACAIQVDSAPLVWVSPSRLNRTNNPMNPSGGSGVS